jgi:signal transduction histidine kinase
LSKVQGPVERLVTDDLLNGSPLAVAAVDQAVRDGVLDRDLVRVKIWREDGTIIYSDEPQLIGTRYELGDDEQASLRTGAIQAHVSDLSEPENRFEQQNGKLLEVYLPIQAASRPVLFEAYYRYSIVEDNGSQLFQSFAPIALGALVVLELVQIPLFWSMARRLRERLREREALLRRTLEASDIERRQIASDLHDGAVQELAGVAYALSAVARRPDTGDDVTPVIEESAEAVRQSIRALRSLIVDIYPPDFGEVDLGSALTDLLGRARDRGLDVALDMDGVDSDAVPEATARLLYRAAQEGVRNTLAHANATSVSVQLSGVDSTIVLDVADDGRGIDDAELAQRRANGHVGLTALGGLLADAGGRMELRPTPEHGTTLHVEVPLA